MDHPVAGAEAVTAAGHQTSGVLTAFGVASLVFMMVMYALEWRGPLFTLGFTAGCALASSYGFASGAWPFGAVEAIWSVVALTRYRGRRSGPDPR